jgi:MtN3 and saliva related transmembrane protein
MSWVHALAIVAGIGSVTSFVPQLIRVIRERDVESVSPTMFAISAATFSLWTIYGWAIDALPVIVSNAACLVLVLLILAVRLAKG